MDGTGTVVVVPRAQGTGRNFTTGLAGSVPDPGTGKLYWITHRSSADDPNALYVSNIDGTGTSRIGSALGGLGDRAWGLSINPNTQRLYWLVGNSSASPPSWTIRSTKVDGTDPVNLPFGPVPKDVGCVPALVIDPAHNLIWWTN